MRFRSLLSILTLAGVLAIGLPAAFAGGNCPHAKAVEAAAMACPEGCCGQDGACAGNCPEKTGGSCPHAKAADAPKPGSAAAGEMACPAGCCGADGACAGNCPATSGGSCPHAKDAPPSKN